MATTNFADHLPTGDHASRPAATAVPEGTLYSCTDHDLIYQSDGATWSTWATVGGPVGGGSINQVSAIHTGNHNITSTTFVDVSASDTLDITTTGGDLFIQYRAAISVNGGTIAHLDFTLDGTSISGTANGINSINSTTVQPVTLWAVVTSLAAGTYTVRPRARVGGSSVDIGQTTDLQHQLFAWEMPA